MALQQYFATKKVQGVSDWGAILCVTGMKTEIACGIVKGLSKFWKCQEFQDFTVKIDSVEFGCHQLLLAACSDLFRGLFRSGMKEVEQKCAIINGISSEIFELLLESIYTGRDVLNKENIIDIWRAAHQLQIHFIVSECENFAIKTLSLENYIAYLQTCKALNSSRAQSQVWKFIQKNCNHFFETSYFLEIPISEIENLVKSQDLSTKSEDEVIRAILKWSEFSVLEDDHDELRNSENKEKKSISNKNDQIEEFRDDDGAVPSRKKTKYCHLSDTGEFNTLDNDIEIGAKSVFNGVNRHSEGVNLNDIRCKNLKKVLSNARTYLVSHECLKMLANHTLVKDNKEVKDIIIEALLYKLQTDKRNGYWPPRAIRRNNSKFKHCLVSAKVIGTEAMIHFKILGRREWFQLQSLSEITQVMLSATDDKLFAICTKPTTNLNYNYYPYRYTMQLSINLLKADTWSYINLPLILSSQTFSVVMVRSFLYIISSEEKKMWKLDIDTYTLTEMLGLSETIVDCQVVPYEQSILVFYDSTDESKEEARVQCYDTSNNTWTQLNNLEGPAKEMVSFIDEHFTYILQSNGNLWKVVKQESSVINFEFVTKLWNCKWRLFGATTFMGELYIHGARYSVTNDDLNAKIFVPGVFRCIHYLRINSDQKQMSIPFLLERNTEG